MDTRPQKIRILLVGGGTGGHFYPLISIAEALNALPQPPQLYFAGPNRYDTEALTTEGITFVSIPAGKQRRYASLLNFFDIFKTLFGVIVSVFKLFIIYPDVVMSKGGYTSVPIIFAAAFLRIPIVVHESDAIMGKANKIGSCFARYVITTYEGMELPRGSDRIRTLGIPIRKILRAPVSADAYKTLGVVAGRPVILIIGGSQGAERINRLILDSLDELLTEYTLIHQTGVENFELTKLSAEQLIPDEERRQHYHVVSFLSGALLNDAYHIASLVISRAGSNSIYEIAQHGKPSVLIPIPEEVSHDQRTNAYTYARYGAATVMEEHNLTDGLLRAEIDRIMHGEGVLKVMGETALSFGKTDSAEQVGSLLVSIGEEH